jgi:uncharacterized protein YjbI with pentapeptide repeats
MGRSNFTGADLSGANLSKAESSARDAVRQPGGANLTGADLARVNLAGRSRCRAQLHQSRLFLTRIEGVDLSQAQGLTQAQLDSACGECQARCCPRA